VMLWARGARLKWKFSQSPVRNMSASAINYCYQERARNLRDARTTTLRESRAAANKNVRSGALHKIKETMPPPDVALSR